MMRKISGGFTTDIVVEGDLDKAVLERILIKLGIEVGRRYVLQGKDNIKRNLLQYNHAARYGNWVVLVDLNQDAECPPLLLSKWLPNRNPSLQLRVAVPEVEAWLLADRRGMARFLKVPEQRLPLMPEREVDPKRTLINIARHSRNRSIREDIVPAVGSTARQGKGYTSRLIDFVVNYWNPERAARISPSLKHTLNSLSRWRKYDSQH